MEIWKLVKDSHYQVSNLGRVRSLTHTIKQRHPKNLDKVMEVTYKGKVLKQRKDKQGRMQVTLSINRKHRTHRVHQLVAEAFLGYERTGTSAGFVVDHISNDSTDNRLENLQIISQRLNTSKDKKGVLPTGVAYDKRCKTNPYKAYARFNGKTKYLGCFPTAELAGQEYLKAIGE